MTIFQFQNEQFIDFEQSLFIFAPDEKCNITGSPEMYFQLFMNLLILLAGQVVRLFKSFKIICHFRCNGGCFWFGLHLATGQYSIVHITAAFSSDDCLNT